MKVFKYISGILVVAALAASCQKHVIQFIGEEPVGDDMARFQVCYFPPVTVNTTNAIDSVFVNGKVVSGVGGAGQLAVNAMFPKYQSGCFFTAPKGNINIQLYQKGKVSYDKTVVINETNPKQVLIAGLDKDPYILDCGYPYTVSSGTPSSVETFDSDSVASIRFVNVMHEKDAAGNVVPTSRKLQYQWRFNDDKQDVAGDVDTYHWKNLGAPVSFGEATERTLVIVHKDTYNSSGYSTIRYRVYDPASGETLDTDYWTAYIGRAVDHWFRGIYKGSPASAVTQTAANY